MPTLARRPRLARRPLDRVDDVGLLAGPRPVEAAVRAAEAAQVDHHERVALLQQARPLDEVLEPLRRTGVRPDRVVVRALRRPRRPGLAGVVEVRADRQDHRRLVGVRGALGTQDVGVQGRIARARRRLDPRLGPVGIRIGHAGGGRHRRRDGERRRRHGKSEQESNGHLRLPPAAELWTRLPRGRDRNATPPPCPGRRFLHERIGRRREPSTLRPTTRYQSAGLRFGGPGRG